MLALVASALSIGCMASLSSAPEPRRAAESFSPNMVVTGAELSRDGRDESLLNALRRQRPWFLGSRGTMPMVVVDGSPAAELSVLETIRVSAISEVQLLRASSSPGRAAFSSTGRVIVGDVLLVRTRPDRS
jgi:hypothetical protein